jgi:hypothetical protein
MRKNDPRDRGAMYGALPLMVEAVEALDALIRLDKGLEFIAAHEDSGNAEMIVTLDAYERCVHALEKLGVE